MIEEFPYSLDETGKCETLDENNMCKVYDDRPDICNVKRVRDRAFPYMEDFVWFNLNMDICKELMRNDGYGEQEIDEIYAENLHSRMC